ncbi:MAG: nuclease [Acidobacteriia bacterium]|nr:nuclease [Terriglobia bacterium]
MKKILSLVSISLLVLPTLNAWGVRGHTVANLAAVEGIPPDGPAFLRAQEAYIGHLGTIPDTWRSVAEPYLRISEDANHGWYTEGFDFIPDPPHSRTEFILRVYDEYLRVKAADPERAKLLNIRYTGTQAYSIIEGYERMKAGMRLYRAIGNPQSAANNLASTLEGISPLFRDPAQVKQMLANDIAFYMGWVGHYVADAAQPLHNSIHHDGWSGDNPKGYTRDPNIHGRFESRYVDLIEVTSADVVKYMGKDARHLDDVWKATLDHSLEARNSVEDVYRLDLGGAFEKKESTEARELVYKRLASGASFLRDLAYTAWIESAKPVPRIDPINQMQNPANPKYNPAAGSAPAP